MNSSQSLPASSKSARSVNRWLVLANVSLGTFMSTLDGSIANVALPTLSTHLHTSLSIIQWVLTAYLLTICATLPIMGKLSDMFGRGRIFNYGFLIFAGGSALCALSGSLAMLIVSRIIQALGASCLMSNSQAIVAETFPPTERGRAMGIVGTMVSLGSLTGPGIGGILVANLGWPSIFWINVPIGVIGYIAGLYLLRSNKESSVAQPFDYTGSALFMVGIVALLYTVSSAQDWGWSSAAVLIGVIGSVAVLAGFYLWERRTRFPMFDFSLYRNRTFAIGNITAFLSFVALFFINIMLPFYMEGVLGFSIDRTGYVMMVNPLCMAVVAPLSGWLSDKIGPNLLTTAGLAINATAFALLTNLGSHDTAGIVALHLALFGIGSGLFQSPNNSSVMGAVPRTQLGSAGGLNALVRNVGMVVGISASVSLYTTRLHHLGGSAAGSAFGASTPAILGSLHMVFWTAAGVCIVALLFSSQRLFVRNRAS
ncbi:MFS transporter [Gorillibacterium massiliense]|uniref:MFS transporter n=1 Tax=Gorillibacterium massiliense TaxID=1280390 RepID=UPI00059398A1|nr:MFS transporter [Gorillibacterium massiliense]